MGTLADRRLLVTSRDPDSGEPIVELVHETLIREWGLLRQWLAEDHGFLTWREALETDYFQWKASTERRTDHDLELLLRGSALDQALQWLERRPRELRHNLVQFIQLSDRTQRCRLTRDRRRVRLLAVLLVLAIGLGSFAAHQTHRARQEAQLATSRRLAAQAVAFSTRQPDVAQLLSLESLRTAPTQEAWDSIRTTLSRPLHASRVLAEHDNRVLDVAFSPDGSLLATASEDTPARLWALPQTWISRSCELVGHNLSQADWERYIGAPVPYVRHCPQYPSGTGADPAARVADYPDGS